MATPSGSEAVLGLPMMTIRAPATTATVADNAVTRNTPTRLRRGRRCGGRARAIAGYPRAPAAGERLRCCDNAVLPSAKRCRAGRPVRGPLRYRAASRMTANWLGVPGAQTEDADLVSRTVAA